MSIRRQLLATLLAGLALAAVGSLVLVVVARIGIWIWMAAICCALLAIGWFILRVATGAQVRRELDQGEIDPRLLGVGSKHYASILALGALAAFLAWAAVRVPTPVALICVVLISLCALAIGQIRSRGFKLRQLRTNWSKPSQQPNHRESLHRNEPQQRQQRNEPSGPHPWESQQQEPHQRTETHKPQYRNDQVVR